MLKFNNTNIITGYIKQLLASFNLPKYYVYTQQQKAYHADYEEKYNAAVKQVATLTEAIKHITDPELLSRAKEQLENAKATLIELQNTDSELNVFSTIYRNDSPTYLKTYNYSTGKTSTDINYPTRMRYMPYIKDGRIQEYANGTWKDCHATFDAGHEEIHTEKSSQFKIKQYNYNQKEPNYTKNLIIKDNIYDSYTHEYLGNYLRFQRDYNNLDLMPLYNCFSNRVCPNLDIEIPLIKTIVSADTGETYLYTKNALTLGTVILQNYSGEVFVYGSYSAGVRTTRITGINGVYDLAGFEYFTVVNSTSASNCSSIAVYGKPTSGGELGQLIGNILATDLASIASTEEQTMVTAAITFAYCNCYALNNVIQFKGSSDISSYTATFQTADPEYKIYMIPVKLFKNYTIAIDSEFGAELCCGIYGKYQDTQTRFENIPYMTYACFNTLQFKTPVLYTGIQNLTALADDTHISELAQHEGDLKLFIKLPIKNKSSIVILEGDCTEYNDTFMVDTISEKGMIELRATFEKTYPQFVPGVTHITETLITPFVVCLETTANETYRDAMRTILADFPQGSLAYYQGMLDNKNATFKGVNGITKAMLDTIKQEIELVFGEGAVEQKKFDGGLNGLLLNDMSGASGKIFSAVQRVTNHTIINFDGEEFDLLDNLITPLQLLRENTGISYPFADRLVEYLVGNVITAFDTIPDNIERAKTVVKTNTNPKVLDITTDGIWTPSLRLIFYSFINNNYNTNDINHDILGYVDKDIEAKYSDSTHNTISRVNIYGKTWEE